MGIKGAWDNKVTGKCRRKDGVGNGIKLPGNNSPRRWEDRDIKRLRDAVGTKQGGDWFSAECVSPSRLFSSKSTARKRASAEIANMPFPLAQHIAKTFYPYAERICAG